MAKSFKKACRTRWLSMEKAIDGVFDDFEALCQTVCTMEDGDSFGNRSVKSDSEHQVFINSLCCMQYYRHSLT